jgi:uncharacterized protein (TIGR00290 family)
VPEPVLHCWSGGKDSCLALAELRRAGTPVAALVTTVTDPYDRVSMHGVRRTLVAAQAHALDLPLTAVSIPADASNAIYEARMDAALAPYRERGVATVAFGDLFLADIRRYREEWLARGGMQAVFPLWRRDTRALSRRCIAEGYHAIVTCVDTRTLPATLAGRLYDEALLADLPPEADPCGENGEFHTFVFDAPIFSHRIAVRRGQTVVRGDWCFCDLEPGEGGS